MEKPDWAAPLAEAYERSLAYLTALPDRPVGSVTSAPDLRAALDGPLPEAPADPREVIAGLAAAAESGLVGTQSGRFFGFVVGGANPAALAADWLTTVWDQNACLFALAPAASMVEEVAGKWLIQLLGLPAHASAGFVTGGQMANFTALAAARHEMLRRQGWDVEAEGLAGAPRLRVLAGRQRHDTVDRAARFLGLGSATITSVDTDDQGRMLPHALADALAGSDRPAIVCAQVGGVNTGAFDPVGDICAVAHEAGAWVHVDGAFGLWAAASPRLRHLTAGVERADSWATDGHKWLNVPYDSGFVFCAHPRAHRAAMGVRAGYLIHGAEGERDALDHTPEFSRRARGFPVYAAIRALGRTGVAELVERCCTLAGSFAEQLAAHDGVEILNDVVLNQVLVRFRAADGDHDGHTRAVIERVRRDGTCWTNGTTWQGRAAMRISVSNWSTDQGDVDRSVAAILRCAQPDAEA
ncbi:pyridoxal phosphate-dependent decarboxylase family protein [Streptosporangium lutulentum]|uniref:Glutamate/tyrosine decarboxylase-like PLP-dependent enzyme n=1 Tax=Streptosporangium lutulentum TaxID=1461250 RepID=A0ABT9QIL3_9ACTN|nr:aminotransferase class V-fold PLP-dependent enzyme [Streptosporangium lutulentum]MDP9846598.1 glutamate/tyrosine decarboxylase-like PLP-dependent enzyme [Streptosporangium lutulentum]